MRQGLQLCVLCVNGSCKNAYRWFQIRLNKNESVAGQPLPLAWNFNMSCLDSSTVSIHHYFLWDKLRKFGTQLLTLKLNISKSTQVTTFKFAYMCSLQTRKQTRRIIYSYKIRLGRNRHASLKKKKLKTASSDGNIKKNIFDFSEIFLYRVLHVLALS